MQTEDWNTYTPVARTYELDSYDEHGGADHGVTVTRREFIELKRYLAKLRGVEFTGDLDEYGARIEAPATAKIVLPRCKEDREWDSRANQWIGKLEEWLNKVDASERESLTLHYLTSLGVMLHVCEWGKSGNYPTETLIENLMFRLQNNEMPTPEEVQELADEYEQEYRAMVADARRVVAGDPNALAETAATV